MKRVLVTLNQWDMMPLVNQMRGPQAPQQIIIADNFKKIFLFLKLLVKLKYI
jgi:hypothetical protein